MNAKREGGADGWTLEQIHASGALPFQTLQAAVEWHRTSRELTPNRLHRYTEEESAQRAQKFVEVDSEGNENIEECKPAFQIVPGGEWMQVVQVIDRWFRQQVPVQVGNRANAGVVYRQDWFNICAEIVQRTGGERAILDFLRHMLRELPWLGIMWPTSSGAEPILAKPVGCEFPEEERDYAQTAEEWIQYQGVDGLAEAVRVQRTLETLVRWSQKAAFVGGRVRAHVRPPVPQMANLDLLEGKAGAIWRRLTARLFSLTSEQVTRRKFDMLAGAAAYEHEDLRDTREFADVEHARKHLGRLDESGCFQKLVAEICEEWPIQTADIAEPSDSTRSPERIRQAHPDCSHSDDFTSVTWYGTRYAFSKGNQANAIRVLWGQWEKGEHSLSQETIGELIESAAQHFELSKTFRCRRGVRHEQHPAWGTMIREESKGVYRLVSPDS